MGIKNSKYGSYNAQKKERSLSKKAYSQRTVHFFPLAEQAIYDDKRRSSLIQKRPRTEKLPQRPYTFVGTENEYRFIRNDLRRSCDGSHSPNSTVLNEETQRITTGDAGEELYYTIRYEDDSPNHPPLSEVKLESRKISVKNKEHTLAQYIEDSNRNGRPLFIEIENQKIQLEMVTVPNMSGNEKQKQFVEVEMHNQRRRNCENEKKYEVKQSRENSNADSESSEDEESITKGKIENHRKNLSATEQDTSEDEESGSCTSWDSLETQYDLPKPVKIEEFFVNEFWQPQRVRGSSLTITGEESAEGSVKELATYENSVCTSNLQFNTPELQVPFVQEKPRSPNFVVFYQKIDYNDSSSDESFKSCEDTLATSDDFLPESFDINDVSLSTIEEESDDSEKNSPPSGVRNKSIIAKWMQDIGIRRSNKKVNSKPLVVTEPQEEEVAKQPHPYYVYNNLQFKFKHPHENINSNEIHLEENSVEVETLTQQNHPAFKEKHDFESERLSYFDNATYFHDKDLLQFNSKKSNDLNYISSPISEENEERLNSSHDKFKQDNAKTSSDEDKMRNEQEKGSQPKINERMYDKFSGSGSSSDNEHSSDSKDFERDYEDGDGKFVENDMSYNQNKIPYFSSNSITEIINPEYINMIKYEEPYYENASCAETNAPPKATGELAVMLDMSKEKTVSSFSSSTNSLNEHYEEMHVIEEKKLTPEYENIIMCEEPHYENSTAAKEIALCKKEDLLGMLNTSKLGIRSISTSSTNSSNVEYEEVLEEQSTHEKEETPRRQSIYLLEENAPIRKVSSIINRFLNSEREYYSSMGVHTWGAHDEKRSKNKQMVAEIYKMHNPDYTSLRSTKSEYKNEKDSSKQTYEGDYFAEINKFLDSERGYYSHMEERNWGTQKEKPMENLNIRDLKNKEIIAEMYEIDNPIYTSLGSMKLDLKNEEYSSINEKTYEKTYSIEANSSGESSEEINKFVDSNRECYSHVVVDTSETRKEFENSLESKEAVTEIDDPICTSPGSIKPDVKSEESSTTTEQTYERVYSIESDSSDESSEENLGETKREEEMTLNYNANEQDVLQIEEIRNNVRRIRRDVEEGSNNPMHLLELLREMRKINGMFYGSFCAEVLKLQQKALQEIQECINFIDSKK